MPRNPPQRGQAGPCPASHRQYLTLAMSARAVANARPPRGSHAKVSTTGAVMGVWTVLRTFRAPSRLADARTAEGPKALRYRWTDEAMGRACKKGCQSHAALSHCARRTSGKVGLLGLSTPLASRLGWLGIIIGGSGGQLPARTGRRVCMESGAIQYGLANRRLTLIFPARDPSQRGIRSGLKEMISSPVSNSEAP